MSSLPTLQHRLKDQARREVADVAMRLFIEGGFDSTTVDQICAAAGLSRRTFFRYFQGKESVVVAVLNELADAGSLMFAARPDDDVWSVLRHCMDPFVAWSEENHARALETIRLVEEDSALRSAYLLRVDQWRGSLTQLVAARLGPLPDRDLRAAVVAAAGMGAFLAGGREWQLGGGEASLAEVFDRAFAAMSPTPGLGPVQNRRA